MTKEEFEKMYCEQRGITIQEYHTKYNLVTWSCNCNEESCRGWAAIINQPRSIENHKRLFC